MGIDASLSCILLNCFFLVSSELKYCEVKNKLFSIRVVAALRQSKALASIQSFFSFFVVVYYLKGESKSVPRKRI